jgi:DNA-binding NtrC family response regulator
MLVQQHILIVAHDPFLRDTRKALLSSADYHVTSVDSDDLAITSVDRDRFDLILIGRSSLLATNALDQRLRERYPALCVLKIVPVGDADSPFASRTTGPEPAHVLAAVRDLLFTKPPRSSSLR